uniref:NPC1_N domain-containing protein n=1 Tax=Mesocestoides corti TaxID=53468 RepID=A0A5K3FX17_MESCO
IIVLWLIFQESTSSNVLISSPQTLQFEKCQLLKSSFAKILPQGCNACRQGPTCDLPYNNPPEFSALEYLVRPRLQDYTQKVAQLIATDMDLCAAPNAPP